jgi:hypothetical protein
MKNHSIFCLFLLYPLFFISCSKVPKEKDISIKKNDTITLQPSIVSFKVDSVYFAIVFRDGKILPFALWEANDQFSNPWSQSFYGEDTNISIQPGIKVPNTWYFYSDNLKIQNLEFQIDSLVLSDIQCYRNWMYVSNLHIGQKDLWHLGFATTAQISFISDSEMIHIEPDINKIRQQLNMLPSGTPGYEGSYSYEVLGYFRIFNRLLGVGISLPWESEHYEVFEISKGYGKKLIHVDGGGC